MVVPPGEAMIWGLLAAGVPAKNLQALDVDKERQQKVCGKYKIRPAKDLAGAMTADAAVIAVKPQQLDRLLSDLAALKSRRPLLLSIVAGAPIKRFRDQLGARLKMVRAMPNTPGLIGQGVSAYCAGPGCLSRDVA